MPFEFDGSTKAYLTSLSAALAAVDPREMDDAAAAIEAAWRRGAQIITLGNGGSAMIALHFVTDWNKSVYLHSGRQFRGRSLVDNLGLLMAYANDVSYDDVFVEQLKNIMQPGDLVVAISGSGESENVIRAVDFANDNGGVTLGLCGYGGGRLRRRAANVIWSRADDMQLSEDLFAIFGHVVMKRLCGER